MQVTIHALQSSENTEVYRKVRRPRLITSDSPQCFAIMDTYFPEDEEPEIEAQVGEGGQFAFNDQLAAPSGGFSFGGAQHADDSMAS